MPALVALVRALNVGGTGKLPMADLRRLCEDAGLERVRTYIQSGNVVFRTRRSPARVEADLAKALAAKLGKPVAVRVRTAAEMARVEQANPFPDAPPNRVLVAFLPEKPAEKALEDWPVPGPEELRLRGRELFVHFPQGQGRSKLKLPFADSATARNLNTVAKLAEMARELGEG